MSTGSKLPKAEQVSEEGFGSAVEPASAGNERRAGLEPLADSIAESGAVSRAEPANVSGAGGRSISRAESETVFGAVLGDSSRGESESVSGSEARAGAGLEASLAGLESASAQSAPAGWAEAGGNSSAPGAGSSDSEDFPEVPPPFLGTWKNIYWFLAIQMFVFAALFYWLTRWAE